MQNTHELLLTIATQSLDVAMNLLAKAESFVVERGINEYELMQATLAPNMFSFTKQIQLISDSAKGYPARLLGTAPVSMHDTESTIAELKERIVKTKALLVKYATADFSNADTQHIAFPWMAGKHFIGKEFVLDFAIPNIYFHLTTAYAILRNQGVPLGKMDFLLHTKMHDDE